MYTEQRNESLNRKGNMLGGWDLYIHTTTCKIGNQRGPTV